MHEGVAGASTRSRTCSSALARSHGQGEEVVAARSRKENFVVVMAGKSLGF